MTIPSTIRIGARSYSVIMIDPDPDANFGRSSDGEILGQIDYNQQTIKLLATDCCTQTMEASLLHEIVHGLAFDLGYSGDHNEREVDLFANALHRLILDNPDLFAEG